MKVLVVWSSVTGNTEKIARAAARGCPGARVCSVDKAPDPAGFGPVFLAFWCDKGEIDANSLAYLGRIRDAAKAKGTPIDVAFFGTMGGEPESERARQWLQRKVAEQAGAGELIRPIGAQLWQGRIDPRVVERMKRVMPMPPERLARIEAAASHPDAQDERQAAQWAAGILQAYAEERESVPQGEV